MNKRILALVMATISSSVLAAAPPISATSNFQSSATLSAACQVSVNPLSFGTITPSTMDTLVSSTMTLTCSKGLVATVGMIGGNSFTSYERFMVGSNGNTDQLKYNVFTPTRGYDDENPWGPVITEDFETDGKEQVLSILGKVYGNQYIKPDTYTDSLTVTIDY